MKLSVVIEKDEDGYYIGNVPSLPGCHTQARSIDELMERIKEAIALYIEVSGVDRGEHREFIGVQFVEVEGC
ncbi:type II toxin-antitoxin system HicB family antitoxin [uncultured Methanofollis sp.]|uniref:type II toxin-antitoxin system HicB family antitoxin n=1 Tax=uncultured Methanofollis sp. TaxID=262500 RepID=UPI00262F4FDB|nr:type II toxin-antitoxin system HicB family antitoxin [uncultured Methanofollis sp.]